MSTDAPTEEKKPTHTKFVVRCGSTRTLHVATSRKEFGYGAIVVVRTERGSEVGDVLCVATPQAVSHLSDPPDGQILRALTKDDENDLKHIEDQCKQEFAACKKHIQRLNLDMQLVDVEHILGGERVVVYYLSEKRVDFRQLVRDLASEFQTRIEMRQIGVRDEAKLLADYGDCGKPVCCNTHLSAMPPVSMKMAKLQKATLDPSKISGRCGRLKCCLRYEFDTYEEMQKELPPFGSTILTRDGKMTVLQQEILAQQLLVKTEDNRRVLIDVSDVLSVVKVGSGEDNRRNSKGGKGRAPKHREGPPKTEGDN